MTATGSFELSSLRRGVPSELAIPLQPEGVLFLTATEDEDPNLEDRVVDIAANEAKLLRQPATVASDLVQQMAGGAEDEVLKVLQGAGGGSKRKRRSSSKTAKRSGQPPV